MERSYENLPTPRRTVYRAPYRARLELPKIPKVEDEMKEEITRDEILNMQAGREMDALVWMALHGQKPNILMCRYVDGEYQPHAGYPAGHIAPDNYSTDVAAAWEVVTEMQRKNFWFRCSLLSSISFAVFVDDMNNDYKGSGKINEMPLAICRASLLAVMDKE